MMKLVERWQWAHFQCILDSQVFEMLKCKAFCSVQFGLWFIFNGFINLDCNTIFVVVFFNTCYCNVKTKELIYITFGGPTTHPNEYSISALYLKLLLVNYLHQYTTVYMFGKLQKHFWKSVWKIMCTLFFSSKLPCWIFLHTILVDLELYWEWYFKFLLTHMKHTVELEII